MSGTAVFHFDVCKVVAELLGCTRIEAKSRILAKAVELGEITGDEICDCPPAGEQVTVLPQFASPAAEALDKVTRRFDDYMEHGKLRPGQRLCEHNHVVGGNRTCTRCDLADVQRTAIRTNAIAGSSKNRGLL